MLHIDADELIMALEDNGHESEWVLDLTTGEVRYVPADSYLLEADQPHNEFAALVRLMEEEPARFRSIEPIASYESFNFMTEFAEELPDSRAKQDLFHALQRRHPFRQFKDALLDYPELREQWFAYHTQRLLDRAREWLAFEDIEAELVSPRLLGTEGA